jgi:hypothetical protein
MPSRAPEELEPRQEQGWPAKPAQAVQDPEEQGHDAPGTRAEGKKKRRRSKASQAGQLRRAAEWAKRKADANA